MLLRRAPSWPTPSALARTQKLSKKPGPPPIGHRSDILPARAPQSRPRAVDPGRTARRKPPAGGVTPCGPAASRPVPPVALSRRRPRGGRSGIDADETVAVRATAVVGRELSRGVDSAGLKGPSGPGEAGEWQAIGGKGAAGSSQCEGDGGVAVCRRGPGLVRTAPRLGCAGGAGCDGRGIEGEKGKARGEVRVAAGVEIVAEGDAHSSLAQGEFGTGKWFGIEF